MFSSRSGIKGLVVLSFCMLQSSSSRANPPWEERLHSEALPAWDAALADQVSVQGTGRLTRHFVKRSSEFEFGLKANAECVLYTEKRGKDGPTDVYGYNPRYTFRLRSVADRGWSVISVHVGDPSTDPAARTIRNFLELHAKLGGIGCRIPHGLEPLAKYVRGPTTRVISVTPTSWKGDEVVMVKLDIPPASKGDDVRSIVSMHEPNRKWRTLRTIVTGERSLEGKFESFELTTDYEYAPGPDNLLIRTPEDQVFKDANGNSTTVKVERTFEMKRLKSLPDTSEFTLSAYGLPEPVGVEWPRRRSGWLWFAWAAAGCVVIAVVFLVLRHRAARRQTAYPATPS